MKKLMLMLAFVSLSGFAMAQTSELPTQKYSVATNGFWNNWFISAGAAYNAFYSSQESNLAKSPLETFRRNYGAELSLGKWFTPVVGVRVKGSGIWCTQVNGIDEPADCPTVKVWNVAVQTMFNLNNMFCGYKPRVWNISPYVGLGVAHRMDHDASYSPMAQVGLFNQFNVSKRVFISLDVYAQTADESLDGIASIEGEVRPIKRRDSHVGASLGLGINLGKTGWEKTPDLAAITALNAAQLAALNDQLAEQEAENARLKALLAKPLPVNEVVKTVKEVAATPVNVFFALNSARISSKKDLVSLEALVEVAKAHGKSLVVEGYADSRTGSAPYNQTLSEKRANAVVEKLVEMGVARENIDVKAGGGVDVLSPYPYNRRVIVSIK